MGQPATTPSDEMAFRATQPAFSGMPTGHKYMGWWGNLGGPKQKGIASYTVSPMQAAAMKGAFTQYLFNGYKRVLQQAPYVVLPMAVGYGIIKWAAADNEFRNSKGGILAGKTV